MNSLKISFSFENIMLFIWDETSVGYFQSKSWYNATHRVCTAFLCKVVFLSNTKETCKTKWENLSNCWMDWIFPSPFGKSHLFLLLLGCPLGAGYLCRKWYLLELISNALGAPCFFAKKSRNQHCCPFPNVSHVLFRCGCAAERLSLLNSILQH